MCYDTAWIQKRHHITQSYFIVLNSADQTSLNWLTSSMEILGN